MSEKQERHSPSKCTVNSNSSSTKARTKKKKPEDFKFGREIGSGSLSTVYLAQEVDSGMEVAIKVIEKSKVLRKDKNSAVWVERYVLQNSDHSLVGRLISSFHDAHRLYFVLPYAPNGELIHWLHKSPTGCFDVETTRFYISELVLALEYLHSKQIVHRDIKPENMLLGPDLHLMLVDFGSAIVVNNSELKAVKFTGTAQYVSPEMLAGFRSVVSSSQSVESGSSSDASGARPQNGEETSSSSQDSGASGTANEAQGNELTYLMDFWALGCVLFHLLSGQMPFRVDSKRNHDSASVNVELFHKVLKVQYEFPENFADDSAKDMISRLLVADPSKRLGNPESGGHSALKKHPFLCSVDWDSGLSSLVERTPPKFMLNLVNASKLSAKKNNSRNSISHCANNDTGDGSDFWSNIPVGFEACQRYLWQQEVHKIPVTEVLPVKSLRAEKPRPEKPPAEESLIDIEGGALIRYLVNSEIFLSPKNIIMMPNKELYLAHQRVNNPYDQFTQSHLILDYGILYKRRKLRARKRMFLMVEDIRLLYVDPDAMELKGIVRLSALSTFELRNNKTFLIRTPGRDYILEDPCECAQDWVQRVKRYWSLFFSSPT